MKITNYIHKNRNELELTRDDNFIDGRMDMFDLLAARAIMQERKRQDNLIQQTGTSFAK